MAPLYRSFVVRIRQRAPGDVSAGIDIEELTGGRRGRATGEAARRLTEALDAALGVGPQADDAEAAGWRSPDR